MTWIFNETVPDLRFCGWCHGALPATLEHFAPHRLGRYGLQSICRGCQKQDAALRRRLKKENPRPELCPCGKGATDLEHDHETKMFRGYTCRSCNLRARRPYLSGRLWKM